MRQKVFTLSSSVSLLLCLAPLFVWIIEQGTTAFREALVDVGWHSFGVCVCEGDVCFGAFANHGPGYLIELETDHSWGLARHCMAVLFERNPPLAEHPFCVGI